MEQKKGNKSLREIAENSFYQLLVVYSVITVLIVLGFLSKYALYFNILGLIIAILGISVIHKRKFDLKSIENPDYDYDSEHDGYESSEKYKRIIKNPDAYSRIFLIAVFMIFFFKAMPYFNNSIPLGYDTGLYKYAIESSLSNLDNWILQGMEPGFLYLMQLFKFLPTNVILTWLFILFYVLLGISLYFVTKKYFNKEIALISLLIFAVSIIQFKVFAYMYYKNVIGLICMLWALYFLKDNKRIMFIIFASLLGSIHRPTFYIFGLSYFAFAFLNPIQKNGKKFRYKYDLKKLSDNIVNGSLIIIFSSLFYLGKFSKAITTMFKPVLSSFVNTGEAPGTFISFLSYQFSILFYLPFSILGFFYLVAKKKFNMLFYWCLINAIIVYFQFFFYNRFIIHLDIVLIILASVGFTVLIQTKKKFGIIIMIVMLVSSSVVLYQEANSAKPGITQEQLELITELNDTSINSSVMVLTSEYSPFVLAYSNRKTIAPGLFDDDLWSEREWNEFWSNTDKFKTMKLVSYYNKPIYLFAGNKPFNNTCFEIYEQKGDNFIYKYTCKNEN